MKKELSTRLVLIGVLAACTAIPLHIINEQLEQLLGAELRPSLALLVPIAVFALGSALAVKNHS